MADLFTYGTLMDADIMASVCGHRGQTIAAHLKHYQCKQVKNEAYPAIIAKPMKKTKGLLYRNIPDIAITKLDAFEGDQYRREIVTVHLANGKRQPAYCYVWLNEYRALISTKDWSFDAFIKKDKQAFYKDHAEFLSKG